MWYWLKVSTLGCRHHSKQQPYNINTQHTALYNKYHTMPMTPALSTLHPSHHITNTCIHTNNNTPYHIHHPPLPPPYHSLWTTLPYPPISYLYSYKILPLHFCETVYKCCEKAIIKSLPPSVRNYHNSLVLNTCVSLTIYVKRVGSKFMICLTFILLSNGNFFHLIRLRTFYAFVWILFYFSWDKPVLRTPPVPALTDCKYCSQLFANEWPESNNNIHLLQVI
jgi:hypothetical protein